MQHFPIAQLGKPLLVLAAAAFGKAFITERVNMAKLGKPFWQEYKFTNPVSGKIEPKAMYCQPMEDIIICGGVYLQ